MIITEKTKTLQEILASMPDGTMCYIDTIRHLLETDVNVLIAKGFSNDTIVELLKINEWYERVVLSSFTTQKLGIWVGNKNGDILSNIRII